MNRGIFLLILLALIISTISPRVAAGQFVCTQEMADAIQAHFMETVPPAPAHLDLNNDGIIDLTDFSICTAHFGVESSPTPPPTSGGPPPVEINPTVSGPDISAIDSCQYSVGFSLSNFAPNSLVSVQNAYSEVSCLTGETFTNVAWTDTRGPTDGSGNLYISYIHGGTGTYNFTFTDQEGHSGSVSFSAGPTGAPPDAGGGSIPTSESNQPGQPGSETNPPPNPEPDLSQIPLVGSTTPPSGTQWIKVVLPEGIFVRSGPGTSYEIIGRTSAGAEIYFEFVEANSGWYHVRWNGGEGWVSGASQHTMLGTNYTPAPPACPSSIGPDGITAGDYPPERLTQEQRQWLYQVFGHSGTASGGYGGEVCGSAFASSTENFFAMVCRRDHTGPGGIRPGSYNPQDLTPDQRNWLFHEFGNTGEAPVGYGGERCPGQTDNLTHRDAFIASVCSSGYIGPYGMVPGSYNAGELTQPERQWLWNIFGNNPNETASTGYGGERCPGQTENLPAPDRTAPPSDTNGGASGGSTGGNTGGRGGTSSCGGDEPALQATTSLRVRSGPSINSTQIGAIGPGSCYKIIGKNGNSLWLQIEVGGQSGWVCRQFTTDNGSVFVVPVTNNNVEDCLGNITSSNPPPPVPTNQSDYDLGETCTAMPSATLFSANNPEIVGCLRSALEVYMTDEEVLELAALIADCGLVSTTEFVVFLSNIPLYGPVGAAAISFDSQNTANCINDAIDLFVP